ncbi:Ankyrin repeat-containing domain protein [Madurella fahalii]|uniref:Ankyrin repeat-containing domain protein n=1 Tax=Madurella fahalii TaxID=1157608 RepID=A0ABQ0G3J1_9PEZI
MASAPGTARYTVGWIAPLALELTAAVGMLEEYTTLQVPDDDTSYHVGRIGVHYVVMAVCPMMGTQSAATVLANMRRSFRNIKHVLVVGIAGGVPCHSPDLTEQITLGDVVVSIPRQGKAGVVHYEFGAWEDKNTLSVREHMLHPSSALLTAVHNVRIAHTRSPGSRIPEYLRGLRGGLNAHSRQAFEDPGAEHDRLFEDNYPHSNRQKLCEKLCDMTRSKRRNDRGSSAARETDSPRIHYGTIGSANTLVMSSEKRNELHNKHGIICFEMESAGIMSDIPGLVIRGICDYADSHKNKRWQEYAAATAAAYAKEVLLLVPAGGRISSVLDDPEVQPVQRKVPTTFQPAEAHVSASTPFSNYAAPSGRDEQQARLKEKEACLQSLSFCGLDARRQDIAFAHLNTCDWFFETTEFRQWRDRTNLPSHNGVLWVKGKPGSGKSTLMKHTLAHCRRAFRNHTVVAYFFNARGVPLEKTPLGMLRSLVWQLVNEDPSIYERFIPLFRDKQRIHRSEKWDWREPELREFLFLETQHRPSKPLVLLVDALDECSERHVRDVVRFLEELSIRATHANTTLNICLSSRHYPHISMKTYQELVIETTEEHNRDIATYVRDELTKRDKEIEECVLKKASGIFMWVVLVVTMLNKAYDEGKVEAMQQKLREVPDDLDTLFWTILDKDNPDKHETILMLQWVLFARRPLKPEELYYAMLAGTSTDNLAAWDASRITPDDIRRRVINSSRGLIEVRKGKEGSVQFIHESVNDFLLRNQRLQSLDAALKPNPIGTSHNRLKACCLSYIMMVPLPSLKESENATSLRSHYPFLEYASKYIFYHAEAAEGGHVGQAEFLHRLREERYSWERAAASEGYNDIVEILLEKGADVNAQGGYYGTALQAAASEGDNDIVEILLEKGADVNAQGGEYGTALQAAAFGGDNDIVERLLEKGADVNAQGGYYGTALQAAAFGGYDIVEILLEKGADVNAQGGEYGTALQAAASGGDNDIVEILLEKGADVNAQGGRYGTALQAAASEGYNDIVERLLEKGATNPV